jgi:ribokinase
MTEKSVTVVGHAAYDVICTVDAHPGDNASSYIGTWEECFGGGGANIACGLAALGIRTRLCTVTGADFRPYAKNLKACGVMLDGIPSEKKTARAFIFNAGQTQRMYFSWGASADMAHLPARADDRVHIAPCPPDVALRTAKSGRYVAFEPGQDLQKYTTSDLCAVVERTDLVFCNEREFGTLERHVPLDGKTVVVTLSDRGSTVYGTDITVAALPVRCVDPTGAGDAYKAGFWAALIRNCDLQTCCAVGTVAASFVVERTGAQHVPTWERLQERYRKYF